MYYSQPQLPLDGLEALPKRAVLRTVTGYLRDTLTQSDELIDRFKDWLPAFANLQCDTIIGRGLSGGLAVSMLGRHFGLHWAVVRKPQDGSHSEYKVEGEIGERWLFVDDLMTSGHTLRCAYDEIKAHCALRQHKTEFIGAWMYNNKPAEYWTLDALGKSYFRELVDASPAPNAEEKQPEIESKIEDEANRYRYYKILQQEAVKLDWVNIERNAKARNAKLNAQVSRYGQPPFKPFTITNQLDTIHEACKGGVESLKR